LFAIASFAQLPTAKIVGTVKDSSGASVPGAMIKVTNVDTNITRTLTTDSDGSYNALELPTGNYQVQVTATGFKTELRKGITLNVADAPVINFTLEVGATEQEVTVTGEIPLVDTQDATLGGVVGQQSVQNLPLNGRNYVDLSLLQAGVTPDRNSSGMGARRTALMGLRRDRTISRLTAPSRLLRRVATRRMRGAAWAWMASRNIELSPRTSQLSMDWPWEARLWWSAKAERTNSTATRLNLSAIPRSMRGTFS
jgi:hypothetical protein